MNSRFVFSFILIFLLTILFVLARHNPDFNNLDCIDSNVNDSLGHGGLYICEKPFICGNQSDFVCPEDFGSNCSSCPDKACYVKISGHVDIEGVSLYNSSVRLEVRDNELIDYFNMKNINTSVTSKTDSNGDYTIYFYMPPVNYVRLFNATAFDKFTTKIDVFPTVHGYVFNTVSGLTVKKGSSYNFNFSGVKQTCNSDCTNTLGYCDPSCNGINGCVMDNTALNHCKYKRPNYFDKLFDGPGNNVTFYHCCNQGTVVKPKLNINLDCVSGVSCNLNLKKFPDIFVDGRDGLLFNIITRG